MYDWFRKLIIHLWALDPEKFHSATNLQYDLLKENYRRKLWLYGALLLAAGFGIGYIIVSVEPEQIFILFVA